MPINNRQIVTEYLEAKKIKWLTFTGIKWLVNRYTVCANGNFTTLYDVSRLVYSM